MTEHTSGPGLRLVLRNDRSELERLAEAFDDFADRQQVADDPRFQLQLCLEEMVLNVINYGFDGDDDAEHEIEVHFEYQADSRVITVNILDDGRKFDPLTEVPEPDIEAELEDRAVGGLGVYFVREFIDDARYRYEDGKNHLTLIKKLES